MMPLALLMICKWLWNLCHVGNNRKETRVPHKIVLHLSTCRIQSPRAHGASYVRATRSFPPLCVFCVRGFPCCWDGISDEEELRGKGLFHLCWEGTQSTLVAGA